MVPLFEYELPQSSRVANGIYTRTATLSLDKGVRMYGGFSGTEKALAERPSITPDAEFTSTDTIISRDASLVSTDKFSLITGGTDAASADTVLDGFTVMGGIAQRGGGMYNDGSSPSVVNCSFIANHGNEGGGMYNLGGSPSIRSCTFAENDASQGGGMNNSYSSPTITGSVFSANHVFGSGGGMTNFNSSSKVSNCAFAGNSAGDISGNGGGVYNQTQYENSKAKLIFTNCTFSANTTAAGRSGGGMCNEGRGTNAVLSVDVVNCTFAENNAKNNGGGMYNITTTSSNLHTNIANSVFYGNSATSGAEIGSDGQANTHVTVTNCVVSGDYTGGTNITSADPKLIALDKNLKTAANSADVYVYAISSGSSALKFGAPVGTSLSEGVLVPSDDQTGLERVTGVSTDVGAYSYNIRKPDISSLAIDPTSASITAGKFQAISLKSETVIPAIIFNGASWESSSKDIASVNGSGKSALIKALKEGKAIITATLTGNIGSRSATLAPVSLSTDITVTPAPTPTPTPAGSGSGGCNSGLAAIALLAVIPVVMKKKK